MRKTLIALLTLMFLWTSPVWAGGPVVLMGIDAEDGNGAGGSSHGGKTPYTEVAQSILDGVSNGGSGILVIGGGKSPTDDVTEFWDAIGAALIPPQAVTHVNGAPGITAQSFLGFAIIAIASTVNDTPSGGLTSPESDALNARSTHITAHVNGGGGLFGLSQDGVPTPYGYFGGVGAITFNTDLSYEEITATPAGNAVGITDTNLDVSAWHNEYVTFPPFLNVLATNDATGNAAAIGGANVTLGFLDHYLSYDVKKTRGSPWFRPRHVLLEDQFDPEGEPKKFIVFKPDRLLNPAIKTTGEEDPVPTFPDSLINPADHLVGYLIHRAFRTPRHVRQRDIRVVNQFHPIEEPLLVDTLFPVRLLVPSAKDTEGPVDPLDPVSVDHFKCYLVKPSHGAPFFRPRSVDVDDQFTEGPQSFKVLWPVYLCNPVEKTVETPDEPEVTPIQNPDSHLMCYIVKKVGEAPPFGFGFPGHPPFPGHGPVKEGVHTNNQFGPLQLDALKEKELCVPSQKNPPEVDLGG